MLVYIASEYVIKIGYNNYSGIHRFTVVAIISIFLLLS